MAMQWQLFYLLFKFCLASYSLTPIQYTTTRRGGSFPAPEVANISYLLSVLQTVESHFNATTRAHHDNTDFLVRKPRRLHDTQSENIWLGEAGRE